MKKNRLIGCMKGQDLGPGPTRGVADLDGTRDLYHNPDLQPKRRKYNSAYSRDENVILDSIQAIRRTFPDKREQLYYFRQLKALAESGKLDKRGTEAISDIRCAIDEIEIDLGL